MLGDVGAGALRSLYEAIEVVALSLEVVDGGLRPVVRHDRERNSDSD